MKDLSVLVINQKREVFCFFSVVCFYFVANYIDK